MNALPVLTRRHHPTHLRRHPTHRRPRPAHEAVPQPPPQRLEHVSRHRSGRAGRDELAVARLTLRLLRRGALAVLVGLSGYVLLECFAFRVGYPDAASRSALLRWGADRGVQIFAGPPTAVDTLGGFVVWDAGLYLTLVVGIWALTAATRVLRGDEDAGRTELLLSRSVRPGRVVLAHLAVVLLICAAVGLVVAATFVAGGAPVTGAVVYGAALAGYGASAAAVGAVVAQVFATRGATLKAGGAVLGAWVLLRMVANSADSRTWLGWLTPSGWIDQARAFGENRIAVLVVPLVAVAALLAVAVDLRGRRDAGTGLRAEPTASRSRRWGLGGPAAFAWRTGAGTLLAWAAGIAVTGVVVGALLPTVEEVLVGDTGFQDILDAMGMDVAHLVGGFVAMWGELLALVVAVYVAFRVGAVREEEATGRAELLLTRPLSRERWLVGQVAHLLTGIVLLELVAAASLWLAARAAGARLSLADAAEAMANPLPVVALFAGLAVLLLGVLPRLTVPVAVSVPLLAYVLDVAGPLLHWPDAVVGVSPFHHLAQVPLEPFAVGPALIMTGLALALLELGVLAFRRRDLQGL